MMNKREMETHIKILAGIHILMGIPLVGLGAMFVAFSMGFQVLGLASLTAEGTLVGSVFAVLGSALGFFVALPGLFHVILGVGLLYHAGWARICGLIGSGLMLLGTPAVVPLIVGVYGFWILLSDEGTALLRS